MGIKNIFRDLPEGVIEEISEALVGTQHFRLERLIVTAKNAAR